MISTDNAGIYQTLYNYFNGLKNRNLGQLFLAWHPEARISYIHNGKLSLASRAIFENWCQQQDEFSKIVNCRILHLDHEGSVAIAKVVITVEHSQSTLNYTDYLTLMKFSHEKWLVVNKSYHADRVQRTRSM
jgi:hypothetical protein